MPPQCSKATNMPNPKTQKIGFEACLVGQVFYISSTTYKEEVVQKNIVLLGGRTEVFFSNNVTSLLVDDYYVNEFRAMCQKFGPSAIPVISERPSGIVAIANPAMRPPPINPQVIDLRPPSHFPSGVDKAGAIVRSAIFQPHATKLIMCSQGPAKSEDYAKLALLSRHPPTKQSVKHLPAPYPETADELKKIAMLTACAGTDGSLAPSLSPYYPCAKYIPLNAVQTFNSGLTSATLPNSSKAYPLYVTTAKPDNTVFRLMQKAHQLGITITGIGQFMKSVEMYLKPDFNKPKRRPRASNKITLSGYFLKVEDAARKYKAFYKVLKDDPVKYLPLHNRFVSKQVEICGSAIKFLAEVLNVIEALLCGQITMMMPPIETPKSRMRKNAKQEQVVKVLPKVKKKQNHFCECCNVYFSDFSHVFSEKHTLFANNEKNYECIRDVMKTLPTMNDFLYKHSMSSDTPEVGLPIAICDNTNLKCEALSTSAAANPTVDIVKADVKSENEPPLDLVTVVRGVAASCANENAPEPTIKAADFNMDKGFLLEDMPSLGTLTPNMDDSQIKFEFDDDCWNDPLGSKDFNVDGFRDFSEHCKKLLGDTQTNFIPANLSTTVNFVPNIPPPMVALPPHNLPDSPETMKIDSNSTTINTTTTSISLKDDSVVTFASLNPDFSFPSQTQDQQTFSKPPTFDVKTDFVIKQSDNTSNFPSVSDSKSKTKADNMTSVTCDVESLPAKNVENECFSSVAVSTVEKRMFSSDSSEGECQQNAFIGDVLTRIHSSDGDSKRKKIPLLMKVLPPVQIENNQSHREVHNTKKQKSPKKQLCKRKLPTKWSVSIVPSKTIRLKFTCLRKPEVLKQEYESSGYASICHGGETLESL